MNESSEELTKEVYARFGLAYYFSECLHRELGNTYTILTFKDATHITTPRAEEKMAYAYSLTLGKLVDELKDLLTPDLLSKLEHAVEKRNYLAHHFWFNRIYMMRTDDDMLILIDELSELADLFNGLDEEVQTYFLAKWQEFGITPELIKTTLDEIIASGEQTPPLPEKRKLQKIEEIIKIWDVPTPDGSSTLVFQTIDGSLWGLSDVGLGWTNFDLVETSWKVNTRLEGYLPAKTNPHPRNSQPWNYEFDLGKGVFLWIKKNDSEKSFKWGIRLLAK